MALVFLLVCYARNTVILHPGDVLLVQEVQTGCLVIGFVFPMVDLEAFG